MWVRKDRAGNVPGHTWEHDGDVVEVPDDLGAELLLIAGFSETEAPKRAEKPDAKNDDDGGEQPAKRRPGRPRKPVAEAPSGDATPDAAKD